MRGPSTGSQLLTSSLRLSGDAAGSLSGARRVAVGDLDAGYFDAGDLDTGLLMPRWAPSTASTSPSTSARSPPLISTRPPPSTSNRSATSTRSTFLGAIGLRDRLRCGATRRRGRPRRGLPTYVWIYPLSSNERDVYFSHVRAVSSRSAVGCACGCGSAFMSLSRKFT